MLLTSFTLIAAIIGACVSYSNALKAEVAKTAIVNKYECISSCTIEIGCKVPKK